MSRHFISTHQQNNAQLLIMHTERVAETMQRMSSGWGRTERKSHHFLFLLYVYTVSKCSKHCDAYLANSLLRSTE